MAALGIPSYQTKSNRNLFVDVSVAPTVPFIKSEETVFPTDSSPSKGSLSPRFINNLGGEKAKSPIKKSNASSFFNRLFCSITGNNSRGNYRPAPVAKGVYIDSRIDDVPANSVKTIDTVHSSDDVEAVWIASNLQNHQRGVPIVIRRPEFDAYNEADDKKLLKKIMSKARKLPQEPGKYASNHVMVNAERTKRNIPPLRRERHMDQIAREQAKLMADEKKLFHIDTPNDLKNRLKEKDRESNELPTFERMGTNIGKGKNIAEVHRFMMAALAERNNIQDKRLFAMGMGAYTAENGVLYMCQIFGG